ncbi:MAG: hypothetical protein GVY08_14390 [Bacteroidetes bacterium]|jgi:hypothetical protein|nr:hypothetical protein [Bacteroidota bacterium]
MLRYFRHLRKTLIEQNNVRKYLLYAIGEILLVVIGILIALQVNNWNEERIERNQEIKILREISNDLKSNYVEIEDIHLSIEQKLSDTNTLLSLIEQEQFTRQQDTLLNVYDDFETGIFNCANTGYQFLRSNGLGIIRNDSLRILITEMYEREFRNIHKREEIQFQLYETIINPFVHANLHLVESQTEYKMYFTPKEDPIPLARQK